MTGTASSTTNAPMRARNWLVVWPSLFVVSMGLMAVLPTLPLYIEQRFGIEDEGEVMWAGLIFAAGPLAAALAGPFWGAVGERVGRKLMVLRAALVVSVLMAVMPFAPTPAWLMVLRILQGIGSGYVAPALALGTDDVPDERRTHVMSYLQVALALGQLVGPTLAVRLLYFTPDRRILFWFASGMALLATVPLLFAIEGPLHAVARKTRAGFAGLRDDMGGLLRERTFPRLLLCIFLLRFGQNMTEPQVSLWVRELGPLPVLTPSLDTLTTAEAEQAMKLALEETTGLAFSLLAIAGLCLAPFWGKLANRFGPLRSLAVIAAGLGACRLAASMTTSIEVYIGLRVVAATFMAGSMPLAYAAASRRVDAGRRALAFGYIQSCMQLGFSTSPILGGFLARQFSLPPVFGLSSFCLLIAAGYMLYVRRDDPVVASPLQGAERPTVVEAAPRN